MGGSCPKCYSQQQINGNRRQQQCLQPYIGIENSSHYRDRSAGQHSQSHYTAGKAAGNCRRQQRHPKTPSGAGKRNSTEKHPRRQLSLPRGSQLHTREQNCRRIASTQQSRNQIPAPLQWNSRQICRCQQQQIINQSVQHKDTVDVDYRHSHPPLSVYLIIKRGPAKYRRKKSSARNCRISACHCFSLMFHAS